MLVAVASQCWSASLTEMIFNTLGNRKKWLNSIKTVCMTVPIGPISLKRIGKLCCEEGQWAWDTNRWCSTHLGLFEELSPMSSRSDKILEHILTSWTEQRSNPENWGWSELDGYFLSSMKPWKFFLLTLGSSVTWVLGKYPVGKFKNYFWGDHNFKLKKFY